MEHNRVYLQGQMTPEEEDKIRNYFIASLPNNHWSRRLLDEIDFLRARLENPYFGNNSCYGRLNLSQFVTRGIITFEKIEQIEK